jgi:uncharacterized protein DUF885
VISSSRRALAVAGLSLFLAAPSPSFAASADVRLRLLGEEFVARRLSRAPHEATRLGTHDTDRELIPVTGVTLNEDRAWLQDFRARLAALERDELTSERAIEYDLLTASAERQRLELDVLRPFERDPGAYVPLVAGSIASVMRAGTAPCERARLASRRLKQIPEVLRAARINLRAPPRVLTEIAIDEFTAAVRFYRETVPALAAGCREGRIQADLAQADTTAVRAVEEFLLYLREDLLPASTGELAIGPEACRRLLWTGLMADVAPVETLLVREERILEQRRAEFDLAMEAAVKGEEGDSTAAVSLGPVRVRPLLERQLDRVGDFVRQRDLVTLPPRGTLGFRAAPLLLLSPDPVALEVPGPWETRSLDAWLEFAPPDSSADGVVVRALLGRFDSWGTQLALMHEVVPGRYLRGLVLRSTPSRLRQALQDAWPAHDWGQYCEQMMIDEGYGNRDPGCRRAAASRALRHAGHSWAALALHAGVMSLDQVRRMLEERCLLGPEEAARDARWIAANPGSMVYTLGARQLLELRDEARRALGPRFQIKVFNDAVLRFGASPAGLVREGVRMELGVPSRDTAVGTGP